MSNFDSDLEDLGFRQPSSEMEDYRRRLEESECYDVGDHVPEDDDSLWIPIRPLRLDFQEDLEMMAKYSNLALERFNRNNNTNYKFVKVLKATFGTPCALRYYITFQVEDMTCPDSPTVSSFRARVFDGWKRESIVEFCGPKP